MDLRQQKLTKSEWEYLEVPVPEKEKKVLQLIHNGWDNINHTSNESKSLLGFMKIMSRKRNETDLDIIFSALAKTNNKEIL